MQNIKPIETIYNGNRFRSRLEARVAVALDEMGIKYFYEPEGYALSSGERYLPDFYLPDLDYYVEVKGKNDHLYADIEKCAKFVEVKKTSIIIITEIPYASEAEGLYWFPVINYNAKYCRGLDYGHAFFQAYDEETIIQDDYAVGRERIWHTWKYRNDNDGLYRELTPIPGNVLDEESPFKIRGNHLSLITNAFYKARGKRFEF